MALSKRPNKPIDEQILSDFEYAWSHANATLIIKHLSPEFVYDSQWVFESLDYKGYVDYIKEKFDTVKRDGVIPTAKIVDDPYGGPNGKMIRLNQCGSIGYYRIKIKDGKVIKGDMCMF